MKSPKEKAGELILRFKPNVYCFVGSGMLSNDYDDRIAILHAKECSNICVDEILSVVTTIADKKYDYWAEVKREIEML